MKTLLFCTAYCSDMEQWQQRVGRWINAAESGGLEFDTILIPDDGSPVLPQWSGVEVINEGPLPDVEPESRGVIYHFKDNLGRKSIYVYPGWYRSFMFAAEYAKKYGYEKVIHMESDAFVISERMVNHINQFNDGWETYWCLRYQLPETSIQVISGSSLNKYFNISAEPYAKFSGKPADPGREQGQAWLPYTVNQSFYGDRWAENGEPTPKSADYSCQINLNSDCWWLSARTKVSKLKVFSHMVDVIGGKDIAEEQLDLFIKSDLISHAEFYFYCNYNESNYQWMKDALSNYPNVNFINLNAKQLDWEIPTLIDLKTKCDESDEEFAVLYIHHKGVRYVNSNLKYKSNTIDWRHLMQYFIVEKWTDCIDKLNEGYDTVGVNWRTNPRPHYSGNFWWARSSYIKQLPKLVNPSSIQYRCQLDGPNTTQPVDKSVYRYDAEFWIGTANSNQYSVYDTMVDHYQTPYPRHLYAS